MVQHWEVSLFEDGSPSAVMDRTFPRHRETAAARSRNIANRTDGPAPRAIFTCESLAKATPGPAARSNWFGALGYGSDSVRQTPPLETATALRQPESRHRRVALHLGRDRESPRQAHHVQARSKRPHAGDRPRRPPRIDSIAGAHQKEVLRDSPAWGFDLKPN
jgi:hypothetical protein